MIRSDRSIHAGAEPVRVLIVGASLDILGGHAVLIRHLIDGFAGSDRVRVSFAAINPRLPGPLRWLQRVKFVRTMATQIAFAIALVRRVPSVDVVHVFSASYFSFLIGPLPALLVARIMGRPTILNYHSGEAADHLEHWPLSRWLISRLSTLIVVPSAYLVSVFSIFRLNTIAIANFVPIEHLPFRERTFKEARLLSNRNLERLYNVACTLRAFKIVQTALPRATLVVAGDGSQRAELERLSKELGLRNVTFCGRVESEKMPAQYALADIFVNGSDIDNMPMSIIEAFASGLAVVSTRAGGIPFIVEDGVTGLLVNRGDSGALAQSVLRLLAEPALATRLTRAARLKCEESYTWEQVRAEWEQAYVLAASAKR